MTKRLYYTGPIKAAYMAKEFGVKLNIRVSPKGEISEYFIDYELMLREQEKGLFYVAKESESIFEPIKGDEGRWSGKRGAHYANYNGEQWVSAGSEEVPPKIIMRDNKHFFNPEIENND